MNEIRYATKLRKLYIKDHFWDEDLVALNNLNSLQNLEELELNVPIFWHFLGVLNLPQLKELTLIGISDNYDMIQNLGNLESLTLHYHPSINHLNLGRFKKLKTLHVVGADMFFSPYHLLKSAPNLENLEIDGYMNGFSQVWAYSNNLKSIVLNIWGGQLSPKNTKILSQVIGSFPNLETFAFYSRYPLDMDDLEKAPRLHTVIQNGVTFQRDLETWNFKQAEDLNISDIPIEFIFKRMLRML